IGIQPDVLLCRCEQPLPDGERRKIALFTNVPENAVISAADVDIIYKQPLWLHKQGLDEIVVKRMGLPAGPADLSSWQRTVDAVEHPKDEVTVAIVGKYVEHKDAYKSLGEALRHGGIKQLTRVNLNWVDSEQVEAEGAAKVLGNADAILVPGGFGKRGFEGKVLAAKYAREKGVPYFGICYGMHAAVVDFARNVAGFTDADSSENDRNTPNPVIALITEWTTATGEVETRSERSDLGGTMRLGAQECRLKAGTLARQLYAQDVVRERHRHRYEFNNRYRQPFEDLGLVISGKSMDDLLVEIVELPQQKHPWFLGCQAHPEFTSTPRDGHPLFIGFVQAAREFKAVREGERLAKESVA
ncbi:CTP synthase, partial [Dyella sp. ASV21]|uniref:CTP synthase n=1 Tax=Dyella sp. ASV21 TaxID=2795114 RepID=UPI0018EE3483